MTTSAVPGLLQVTAAIFAMIGVAATTAGVLLALYRANVDNERYARDREQDAADRADQEANQARLVFVEPAKWNRRVNDRGQLTDQPVFDVTNHSPEPIFGLLAGAVSTNHQPANATAMAHRVLRGGARLTVAPGETARIEIEVLDGTVVVKPASVDLTVRFVDAHGRGWSRRPLSQPQRYTIPDFVAAPADPPQQ